MVIAQNYNARYFKQHFTNFVDIVIGWMMEDQQEDKVKIHCASVLESFKIYWQNDTKFTLDLLGQLLEDIEGCIEKHTSEDVKARERNFKEFVSFVGCLNAIIKSIYVSSEALVYFIGKEMLADVREKVWRVAESALKEENYVKDIVLVVNEFSIIMLHCRNEEGMEVQMETMERMIEMEMQNLTRLDDNETASLLYLITEFVAEFKSELSVDFIQTLFNYDSLLVTTIVLNNDKRIKNGLMKIYHDVLALKNVPVLQTAYKCIIENFGECLQKIESLREIPWISNVGEVAIEKNEKEIVKVFYRLNFTLTALSKLATIQNSIIAMYSLNPSILEVLLALQIWRPQWNECELIQYSILLVTSEHCLKNNNFVSSSTLLINKSSSVAPTSSWLVDSSPTESPASQHFKLIIEFIEKMLKTSPSRRILLLILEWVDKIIQQTSQFSEQLKENLNFLFIMKRINHLSVRYNDEVSLKVANCYDALYTFDNINPEIYTSIAEVCFTQICSVNPEIRRRYSFILSRIPLRFTLEQAKSSSGINQEAIDGITEMENWHLSLGSIHGGELRAQYFQDFIKHITFAPNACDIDNFILNSFKNCWFNGTKMAEKYKNVTLKDVRTLCAWIEWEAARYCVNNKLRTPLGKANDTFIKIEAIIREHARILTLKDNSKSKSYKNVIANQRNVRILLGFMECLEKAIYNAAEGSAFAIPLPEKPARTFFRLNAQTCNEWFNRNRLAIHQLALHCMELEMVIRSSSCILKEMVAAGKVNDSFFDQILLSLTWALLRNFESEALTGIYVWVKNISGRKLHWIKMAAEQAAGHREIAAEGYSKVLRDEKLQPALYDFINDQRKISLLFTQNYDEVYSIVIDEEEKDHKPSTIPILKVTKGQVESMLNYDLTRDTSALDDLALWDSLECNSEVPSNFSVHNLIYLTDATLGIAFLDGSQFTSEKKDISWKILHTLLQECVRTSSQEYLIMLNFMNHNANKIVEHLQKQQSTISAAATVRNNIESLEIEKKYGSLTMLLASLYSELFDAHSEKGEQQNINLKLDLIASARKELNFRQCTRELSRVYKCIEYREHIGLPIGNPNFVNESLSTIKDFLMSQTHCVGSNVWSENVSRAVYEHCKMLYVVKNQHFDAIQFASTAAIGIRNRLRVSVPSDNNILSQQCVKFYIKISEYLQNETDDILLSERQGMSLNILLQSINDEEVYIDGKIPLIDGAIGKLLSVGAKLAPEMNKVWSSYANWCYRWGRKLVESRMNSDGQGLKAINSSAIFELIPHAQSNDVENILRILNEQQIMIEDEDIGPSVSSSTEMIENQLRMIPLLSEQSSSLINEIIKLWKQSHRDVYKYYEMCASAYFKFLLLSSNSSTSLSSNNGNSSVVTATLRLLRLIVKHALGLQEVLEEGLATTPTAPWRVIIPQLFSRLNHHEPYVRKRVSELLCRVANDSPHLIIFPTVVGSQDKSMNVSKITSSTSSSSSSDEEEQNSSLTFCFTALLDTLSMQSPTTVSQVQLFVRELRRISLLWDELWLLSLSQMYAENAKKFLNFEAEFQNFTDKSSEKIILFTEKHRLLMRPLIFVLERLHEWTSKAPETNNEKSFQEKFSHIIDTSIGEMKRPFDANEPLAAFNKFKSLYQLIQQRVHKRMSHTLKMSDISPILANLQNTQISMPGLIPPSSSTSSSVGSDNDAVYIQSVDDTVQILPTKTKPKKLAFYGSDGKRYTFLFKGMEDLHLDERIMQFLSIANLMMKKSVDSDGKVTVYRAHHYSVIPLGLRSGLISWVDGVTPIFSIYKRWQQREAANPRKDKQFVVMRPSEMFYNKITPLLKEQGMKTSDNRKDWPLTVQKKVFEELKAETPKGER
jgi:serine/threonine-protein kinase SMG1